MKSILLVDDDEQFRTMLTEVLERAGYQVFAVADGNEAVKQYQHHQTDLVITDIIMPEKEGLEMITELRHLHPDAKIVAISGGGRGNAQDYLKMAAAFGADRVLAKPFSNREVLETINSVLEPN
jgi:CheY-like chemotaxis protein